MRKKFFSRLILFVGCSLAVFLTSCNQQPQAPSIGGTTALVITHYFNGISAPPGRRSQVTAKCQAGEEVVSGGFGTVASSDTTQPNSPLSKTVIMASYPSDSSSWTVIVFNREDQSVTLSAHIECTPLKGSSIHTAQGTLAGNGIVAVCPQNTQLLGGGFSFDHLQRSTDVIVVQASTPVFQAKSAGWLTAIHNATYSTIDENADYTSYAVCTSASFTTNLGAMQEVKAPMGTTSSDGNGTASCSPHILLAAGMSFANNDGRLAPFLSYPDYTQTPPIWQLSFRSFDAPSIDSPSTNPGGTGYIHPLCGVVSVNVPHLSGAAATSVFKIHP